MVLSRLCKSCTRFGMTASCCDTSPLPCSSTCCRSIRRQFEAFAAGFKILCDGPAIRLFNACEVSGRDTACVGVLFHQMCAQVEGGTQQ